MWAMGPLICGNRFFVCCFVIVIYDFCALICGFNVFIYHFFALICGFKLLICHFFGLICGFNLLIYRFCFVETHFCCFECCFMFIQQMNLKSATELKAG
jgi:hypothetical protein